MNFPAPVEECILSFQLRDPQVEPVLRGVAILRRQRGSLRVQLNKLPKDDRIAKGLKEVEDQLSAAEAGLHEALGLP